MKIKDSYKSKDRDYFKMLLLKHPHLRRFIYIDLPSRFLNLNKVTKCDGIFCIRTLSFDDINIFVTPGPDYKPMVLCVDCLKREYQKVSDSGEYDIHLRHLPKDPTI